jgi:putative addiction module killer protein
MRYELEEYAKENGETPFSDWLEGLKDQKAQRKITQRIRRASLGNFGDFKSIKGTKGLFEMREHYGAGYRVFYSVIEDKIVLLLAGSIKRDQKKAIKQATEYLADYERNN